MARDIYISKGRPNEESGNPPYQRESAHEDANGAPIAPTSSYTRIPSEEALRAQGAREVAEYWARKRAKAGADAGTHHPTEGPVTGFKHDRR